MPVQQLLVAFHPVGVAAATDNAGPPQNIFRRSGRAAPAKAVPPSALGDGWDRRCGVWRDGLQAAAWTWRGDRLVLPWLTITAEGRPCRKRGRGDVTPDRPAAVCRQASDSPAGSHHRARTHPSARGKAGASCRTWHRIVVSGSARGTSTLLRPCADREPETLRIRFGPLSLCHIHAAPALSPMQWAGGGGVMVKRHPVTLTATAVRIRCGFAPRTLRRALPRGVQDLTEHDLAHP